MVVDQLSIVDFNEAWASEAARWRYDPPFDFYDGEPAQKAVLLNKSDPPFGYYAVVDPGGVLVAFCCFGAEARVSGQEPADGTLDVGGGVRPDLLSQGLATAFLPSILQHGADAFAPERFRAAVAAFNERSLRLCRSAGFATTRVFDGPGQPFHELERRGVL